MVSTGLLLLLGATAVLPSTLAHGYIKRPEARQLCVDYSKKVYIPSGAGITTKDPPNGGVPGFCGDPFISPNDYSYESDFASTPCYPQETYEEGGVMDMLFQVTANHGGFITCNLCDSTTMSKECFNEYPLTTVDDDYDRVYILPDFSANFDKKAEMELNINWQLPAGVSCEHCIVSCMYYTSHRCTFPCDEQHCGWYATGVNRIIQGADTKTVYPTCRSLEPERLEDPQIFRNCADIKINPTGGSFGITCADVRVAAEMEQLNGRRADYGAAALACDDVATGAAADAAEEMCNSGSISSAEAANCAAAGMGASCTQLVNVHEKSVFKELEFSVKAFFYKEEGLSKAGIGYHDCGDTTNWVLLGSA